VAATVVASRALTHAVNNSTTLLQSAGNMSRRCHIGTWALAQGERLGVDPADEADRAARAAQQPLAVDHQVGVAGLQPGRPLLDGWDVLAVLALGERQAR
jgi:hypothetical protein